MTVAGAEDHPEAPAEPATPTVKTHSKAFENLVDGPDDVVGLLAYALLKQTVAENARRGYPSEAALRDPGERAVELYRSSATQMLSAFATSIVDDAREELQESAVLERLEETEDRINSHIDRATGFGWSLWTNFVGWLLSVGVTLLVILGLAVTGLGDAFLDRLERALTEPGRPAAVAPPASN